MRLHTDNKINNTDKHTLMQLLQKRKYLSQEAGKEHTITHLKEKLKKYERTRCIMVWHDGSMISKHSHIMMMVSCMCDDVAFLTDDEFEAQNDHRVNVQPLIEKPFIYTLLRCPSDDHQLLYSNERLADIIDLKNKVEHNGILINDIMGVFKGDNPAAQLESGQQQKWRLLLFAMPIIC